jgi:hypothetical protein
MEVLEEPHLYPHLVLFRKDLSIFSLYNVCHFFIIYHRQGCVISFGMSVPEVPYARSSSQPSYMFLSLLPTTFHTERLYHCLLRTPLPRRGLPAWHPGFQHGGDPHRGMCLLL